MTRAAPSVARVISVLNFFAEHPKHGFSLTDVIRALQLNRATCHALLGSLTDAGYLYRDMAKKYRMGPALAAIGRIAYQSFAPVAAARDEMRKIADRHDLVCIAASRVGNELIFLERMVSRSNLQPITETAERHTIAPPGGSSFIAWASQEEVDAWLSAFTPPLDSIGMANVVGALARIRHLRFSYSIRSDERSRTLDPLSQMAFGALAQSVSSGYVPDFAPALEAEKLYPLTYISAPVLGAAQEVLFTLSLSGFPGPVSGSRIFELGEELRRSTEKITNLLSPKSLPGGA